MSPRWLAWMDSDARIERDAVRWIAEFSNDPEGTEPGLNRWLAGNPRRREIYDTLSAELHKSSGAAHSLRHETSRRSTRTNIYARAGRMAAIGIGVAIVVATSIVLFGATGHAPLREFASNRSPAEAARISTAPGEVKRFRLQDGSSVILDGDSALQVAFEKDRRGIILERGRARFDVAHDAARPFVVSAAGGTVTAKGTLFDVWVRPDRKVRVVLLRGAIDVQSPYPAGPTAKRLIELTPGQRLLYNSAQPTAPRDAEPAPASKAETAWMNETMDFDYVPLREVLLEANRHSRAQIELADDKLGDIEVFGTFQLRDTARLAHKLADSLELDVVEGPDRFILAARMKRSIN